jgi:hypothetical protein
LFRSIILKTTLRIVGVPGGSLYPSTEKSILFSSLDDGPYPRIRV